MAMIDNLEQAERLMWLIEEALPLPAMMSPRLVESLRESQPHLKPLQPCTIVGILYTGDVAGIICVLDLGEPDAQHTNLSSITHLLFDRRLPEARAIAAYQKRRIKRLKQLDRWHLTSLDCGDWDSAEAA
jgi:hypothetical protein